MFWNRANGQLLSILSTGKKQKLLCGLKLKIIVKSYIYSSIMSQSVKIYVVI